MSTVVFNIAFYGAIKILTKPLGIKVINLHTLQTRQIVKIIRKSLPKRPENLQQKKQKMEQMVCKKKNHVLRKLMPSLSRAALSLSHLYLN